MNRTAWTATACATLPVALVGAWLNPVQFAFSWLWVFLFFFTICAGSLFWLILHHLVDAEWSVVVRRLWETAAPLLVALAILFIPLVLLAPVLWTWMPPGHPSHLPEGYLNKPFFFTRALLVFVALSLPALLFRAFSVAQDADGAPKYTRLNRRLAGLAVVPFSLALTIAAIDWLMTLQPHWASAIFPAYVFAGSAIAALSATVVLATASPHTAPLFTSEHCHIIGKLMLAFTMFWAYIAYSQYMLIWYGNLPEETSYFRLRATGAWPALGLLLVTGHFFVPFLLLLSRAVKRSPRLLCAIGLWILLMHLLDLYLIVMPVLHPAGFAPHWLDLLSLIAIGSTLGAIFLAVWHTSAPYPIRDPRLARSLALKN